MNDLTPLTNSGLVAPGPRAFMAVGYTVDQLSEMEAFLASVGYEGVPVRYVTEATMPHTVQAVLESASEGPPLTGEALMKVLLLSGMAPFDLKTLMGKFKEIDLPRPIFATSTATNLGFTVETLLSHYEAEKAAFLKNRALQNKAGQKPRPGGKKRKPAKRTKKPMRK